MSHNPSSPYPDKKMQNEMRRAVKSEPLPDDKQHRPFEEQLHYMQRQAQMLAEEGHDISANVMADCAGAYVREHERAEAATLQLGYMKAGTYQQQAKGWETICRLLDEIEPGWSTSAVEYDGKTGIERATDAIRRLSTRSAEQGSFAPYAVPECMSTTGRFSMVNGMEIDTPATRLALELGRDIYKHANEAGVAPLTFAQKITEAVNEALRLRSARSASVLLEKAAQIVESYRTMDDKLPPNSVKMASAIRRLKEQP